MPLDAPPSKSKETSEMLEIDQANKFTLNTSKIIKINQCQHGFWSPIPFYFCFKKKLFEHT